MSRAVPGKPLGPHKYHGTRPDDPNDVIPHEDRRELRGYRVFSAWLNHDDSRSLNSIDSYVKNGDKGYLVHYLQDFSSAFGSGSDWRRMIAPQNPRAGNEYVVELAPLAKTLFSLGIWERPWHKARYEIYPQVGAIEADFFDPDRWKPEYPNPAFDRMLPEDAAWAARIVARFTDEIVRAIVREGDFRAPEAEDHLVSTLLRRRDKVLDRYLRASNPLGDFRLEEGALVFTNHGEDAKLAAVEGYEVEWFAFDNDAGTTTALGPPSERGTGPCRCRRTRPTSSWPASAPSRRPLPRGAAGWTSSCGRPGPRRWWASSASEAIGPQQPYSFRLSSSVTCRGAPERARCSSSSSLAASASGSVTWPPRAALRSMPIITSKPA